MLGSAERRLVVYNRNDMESLKYSRKLTVIVESDPEEGGFVATMPEMPDAVGRGKTEEQALRELMSTLGRIQERFEQPIALETLARKQGVSIGNYEELLGDFWPSDERPEEFTSTLREWRRQSARATT